MYCFLAASGIILINLWIVNASLFGLWMELVYALSRVTFKLYIWFSSFSTFAFRGLLVEMVLRLDRNPIGLIYFPVTVQCLMDEKV